MAKIFKINSFLCNLFKRNLTISTQQINKTPKLAEIAAINHSLTKSNETQVNQKSIICPSLKIFQLPLNDIRIIDILKRQELTLPEINKNKSILDPLLINQVSRELPQRSTATSIECRRPLYSEIKWRQRKMNIKRRKKYLKKMSFKIATRLQNKAKRYQDLLNIISDINTKKTDLFDANRFIDRELEKARFYGYRCSSVYDNYRNAISQGITSFDPKYFRKFDDPKELLHLKLERELLGNKK